MTDFLRLIDVNAGGFRLKKGQGTLHPRFMLLRTHQIGANPEKSDLVNVRGQSWRKFSELCVLLFFPRKNRQNPPKTPAFFGNFTPNLGPRPSMATLMKCTFATSQRWPRLWNVRSPPPKARSDWGSPEEEQARRHHRNAFLRRRVPAGPWCCADQ